MARRNKPAILSCMGAGKGRTRRAQATPRRSRRPGPQAASRRSRRPGPQPSAVVANDLVDLPPNPVTEETVEQLAEAGASKETVEIARELAASQPRLSKAARARKSLLDIFGGIGYREYAEFTGETERRIIDPGLEYSNQWVDGKTSNPPRPYTNLFRYCPHMEGNKAHWIETELRFDHETGDIFVIASVKRPVPFSMSRTGVYDVVNCGRDLQRAINVAQEVYDKTFVTFKESKTGARAKYGEYRFEDQLGPTQVMTYNPEVENVFRASEGLIAAKLVDGVDAMSAQQKLARADEVRRTRALQQAEKLGYV